MKKFAQGICFKKLFWIFVIGSIFGAFYEEIITCYKTFTSTGIITWVYRRGVIYGPISPVYGMGAVLFTIVLIKKKRAWYNTLIYGSLLGGILEYMINLLQEIFIGTTSWNYSNRFLNIGGRTTIPYMIGWGIMSVVFVYAIYPFVSNSIEKIPFKIGNIITYIMVVFLSLDIFISWTALFRQTLRRRGYEPFTKIGEIYDKYYTDDFLKKYYTNMEIKD